ncbi:MAG: nickel transporter [Gammaproteobacteria bacterium]|nr:nickel transporter [Gammaproteobacteria bacterium]MBU1979263.1 nickel transporter [Gammaproteobacteria bacterium]
MENLPNDWLALLSLVFVLGLKHGFDPDHLATIDGLTRFNAANHKPRLSRWSGLLFSLGHGAVVMTVAVLVGLIAKRWDIPAWADDLGAWISILFLLALGAVNLAAVFRAAPGQVIRLVGLKGRWLGKLNQTSHPAMIALIGALFALSFDTLSQTALFSLTASSMAGWLFSAALGMVFMLGMIATDGLNGLWVSRLINKADARAQIASRLMGMTVGGLSIMVGLFGIAKYFFPVVSTRSEGYELLMGLAVIGTVALSFYLALRQAHRQTTPV